MNKAKADQAFQRKKLEELRKSKHVHEKDLDEIIKNLPPKKKIESQIQFNAGQKVKYDEIKGLEEELQEKKECLKIRNIDEIPVNDHLERLRVEVYNLEIHDINLKAQKGRLEDKLTTLKTSYDDANKVLERAHLEALDREEMEYMAQQIENKKNDLMSSRNYVREMQKIGWSFLPPKVADECKKTQIELDYVHKVVKKIKDETEEAVSGLKKTEDDLLFAQEKYNEVQLHNTELEKEIDIIVTEINKISSKMNVKESNAHELEEVAYHMKGKIEEAKKVQEENNKQEELFREEQAKESAKRRAKLKLRNQEVEDLKAEYAALTEKAKQMDEKLSEAQKNYREQKANFKNVERKHYTREEILQEIQDIQKECIEIAAETIKETKLKFMYYNIIEDMLGNLKILCRIRNSKNNSLKVTDDTFIKLKNDDTKYKFDYVFNEHSESTDIFERIEHLYENTSDGYNCYVVTIGEKESGKAYTIIGKGNNGLLFIGLNKLKEVIRNNTKNHLTTRMFVCGVEIVENRIFDLQNNNLSEKYEVKRDYFGMSIISHAKYTECFTEDEVRSCYLKIISNRSKATEALHSKDTNFVCILTAQIYNKFQHRYCKGKITHIRLASMSKNSSLMSELETFAKGKSMNYNTNAMTKLLKDCIGGNAKTCVIGCINPSESDTKETLNTVKLVSSMKAITNEISRNIDSEEIYKLKNNIERLLRGQKQEFM